MEDRPFQKIGETMKKDLRSLNIDIVDKFNKSDNPRVNAQRIAEYDQKVEDNNIKYNIEIIFFTPSGPYKLDTFKYEDLHTSIAIGPAKTKDKANKNIYLLSKNNYKKTLKQLKKVIESL